MNSSRLAVIDLGTNTFHLLIVEASGASWNELYRERIFVNLAEEGIELIYDSARGRAFEALKRFTRIIKDHEISDIQAVGTAALRRAGNAGQFIIDVKAELGIDIRVIDGQKEAEYINAGVMSAVPPLPGNLLIMDIGGGSVEFIISPNRQKKYTYSYPIGVAVLYDKFHHTEPIANHELESLDQYLREVMSDFKDKINGLGNFELIGASGSFEVIDSALQERLAQSPFSSIEMEDFLEMYNHVIPLTFEERKLDQRIPSTRAKYIVVALKLIQHVLSNYPISSFGVSRYALKEGIVSEWHEILA